MIFCFIRIFSISRNVINIWLVTSIMDLLFRYSVQMIRNLRWIWIMLFYVFFCHIIIVNYFLQYFIILLHLIPSFLLTRSLLVPYTWVYIESIDYILLLPLELWAILRISSVKTLCLSLVNLCRGFKINFLFFTNSLWSFLRLPASVSFFF